jgi:hypothetical protein
MAHPSRAHLLSTIPGLRGTRVLRTHQPAPLHSRLHLLLQLCPSLLYQVSLRFMRPPRCAPQNRKPRKVSRTISKQARKLSRCQTTSRLLFARANRHRHLQLRRYVRQKYRQNTTMQSAAANPKRLSSRKEFRLLSLSQLSQSLQDLVNR